MQTSRFSLVIPNERYRLAQIFSHAFVIVTAIALIYASLAMEMPGRIVWAVLALLYISGRIFKPGNWWRKIFRENSGGGYIMLGIGWMGLELYWIMAGVWAVGILYSLMPERFELRFFDNKITMNSFPSREIKWFELNNVVLKDGMLTVDFKNDKLIQGLIHFEESRIDDEATFNEFCRTQIQAQSLSIETL